MAVLKDLIVHGRSRFINGAQFNTINTESIGATEGIFNKLIATTLEAKEATIDDLTATNATIVGLLDVQGEMHTKSWSNSNIATIDGNFYITPTVVSADGADVTASGYTPTGTLTYSSGNYTQMTIAGTFDTSQLTLDDVSSIDWPANSYVIITGEVSVGKEWYPLGTIRGKLGTSIAKGTGAAAKSITIVPIGTQIISGEVGNVSLTDGNGHKPSTLEAIRIAISETSGASLNSLKLRKIKISMTSRASGNDQYALGIYMTAMGSNKKTFLDIYGGSNKNGENVSQTISDITYQSGALAVPTVRIGNLLGLPMVGGITPKGWGIYTNNGFFTGTIVARQGKIGNADQGAWTIGNDSNTGAAYIYTGNLGASPSAYVSTGYGTISIANSGALTGNKKWVFTAGDKFGVTNEGDLYASNATIDGDIIAQSLTIGSGANAYSGIAAINITGYSIEIEVADIAGSTETKKLIPHLLHNGENADSEVTDVTKFLWYIDNNMSVSGAAGLSPDGYIIGEYGHTYKVIYDFGDGVVGSGSAIQTRTVDPQKYITRISDTGITIHPEMLTEQSSWIQLDGNGMELFNSNNESIAKYGSTVRVGSEDDASITITDNSITGTGKGGKEFFNFSDSSTTLIVLKVKTAWDRIKVGVFPRTLEESLSVTLPEEPSSTENTVSLKVDMRYGTSYASKSMAFTVGVAATKSMPLTLGNVSCTINARYDGAKDISKIWMQGGNVPDNYLLSGRVYYNVESLAPCYELGNSVEASGAFAFAEGYDTHAEGDYSHSSGYRTHANGDYSYAEGDNTYAEGNCSHVEGSYSTANGHCAHAEGISVADGYCSHAEGYHSEASGTASHAEGNYTTAGMYSHAEGDHTTATGYYSHAEGSYTTATGRYSHAQNNNTVATEDWQTVIGRYNKATVTGDGTSANPYTYSDVGNYAFIVGNGTDNTTADRSNALTVDWNGNVEAAGEVAGVVHTYGAITGGTWSSKSIATGSTWKELANFTIPEDGVWLLIAELIYASNATGHRTMSIATSSATSGVGIYSDRRQAINGNVETPLRVVILIQGNTKYYVNTYHGASTALTCQGRYTAFKIGNSVNRIDG